MTKHDLKQSEAPKHTIYFLGGSARSGKTTIMGEVLKRKPLVAISSDAVRTAIRNALISETYVDVDELDFSGIATFRRPGSLELHKKTFQKQYRGEEEMAWRGIEGLVDFYGRSNNTDLMIEGIAVTPERVTNLEAGPLAIRAAFVGFTHEGHIDEVLKHARGLERDWINGLIERNNGDDTHVREWARAEIVNSQNLRAEASAHGYGFFDLADYPFDEYVETTANYLLEATS